MAYCTQQDLIDRFGEEELIQLTDRDRVGIIDEAVLDRAIADAEGEINGYLASRYQLPLATTPTSLVRIACDIARYHLFDDVEDGVVTTRYNNAVKFMKAISTGAVSLGIDSVGATPQTNEGAEVQSGGRVFGRDDNGFM